MATDTEFTSLPETSTSELTDQILLKRGAGFMRISSANFKDGAAMAVLQNEIDAVEANVSTLSGSITSGRRGYATYAQLAASPAPAAGTLGEVPPSDTGTHSDPVVGGTKNNSGIFRYSTSPAGWERLYDLLASTPATRAEVNGLADASKPITPWSLGAVLVGGGKNLFNSADITPGWEVYGDGTLQPESQSVISSLIWVRGLRQITVSGLQANPSIIPKGRFLEQNGTIDIGIAYDIAPAGATTVLSVPDSAYWFQFSPKQRNAAAGSYGAVQVEVGGAATAYEAFRDGLVGAIAGRPLARTEVLTTLGGARNLFDKTVFTSGQEVYHDGTLNAQADSVISGPIPVPLESSGVYVSGLQSNPGSNRYWHYLDATGTVVSFGVILDGINEGYAPKADPAATVFQISLRQRYAAANNFNAVQIELGGFKTPYQAYSPRLSALNGVSAVLAPPRYAGLGYLFFGDSITETGNVDASDVNWYSPVRDNWPKVFVPEMWGGASYNYAKSGGHFSSAAGLTTNQKLENQIAKAVTDARAPDVIIVGMGTNDLGNSAAIGTGSVVLSDFATAMAKAFGSLDRTITLDAARYGFATICDQWPDAIKFYMTPAHRGDLSADAMRPHVDELIKMAKRYCFTVIDAFNESGIIYDYEIGGLVDDLPDNLHPNAKGIRKLGRLAAARVKARVGA